MSPCKYQEQAGCETCNVLYHRECKKFIKEHYKFLGAVLFPFKYTQVKPTQTGWSRDINVAKSNALMLATIHNSPVKKMTLSQVLSAVLSGLEIEATVIYIEYDRKAQGDPDKVTSCLNSFIEQQTLRGAYLSVYVNPTIHCNLDLYRFESTKK